MKEAGARDSGCCRCWSPSSVLPLDRLLPSGSALHSASASSLAAAAAESVRAAAAAAAGVDAAAVCGEKTTMRGRSCGRAAAASLEQADALLFDVAAAGGAGTDAALGGAATRCQQQKLRCCAPESAASTSVAATAGGDSPFVLPVLALLFSLSVCGFVFFFFLSCLFLGALDTLALPLATKRAAGRASVAAAVFHLACLVGLGMLLQQQHPEQRLRRFRAFLFSVGKRGGRAVLKSASYLLRRGIPVARDCWLRMTNADAAAAAGAASVSSSFRGRDTADAAAALAGGATLLPYCSRNSGDNRPLPDARNTDCATLQSPNTMYIRGQRQPERAVVVGSHASPFSSSVPTATAAGFEGYRGDVESMSPSHSKAWKGRLTTVGDEGAVAATAHRREDAGRVSINRTSPLAVTSGRNSGRARDSSAGDSRSAETADAFGHSAATNTASDNLLLLMSPPTDSHERRPCAPSGVTLPPATFSAAPPVAAVESDAVRGAAVRPDAVFLTFPLAACSDSTVNPLAVSALPGVRVEGKHAMNENEATSGVCHRSANISNSSPYCDVMHMRSAAAGFPSSVVKGDSYLSNPHISGSDNCGSNGTAGLWSNNSGLLGQQQGVNSFQGKPPRQHQAVHVPYQEQAQHVLFMAGGQQDMVRQEQMQSPLQQQRAQWMLQRQVVNQQQHVGEQLRQQGVQNCFRENSHVTPTLAHQGQPVTPWPPAPAAVVAHTSNNNCFAAGQVLSGGARSVPTATFMGEPQGPPQALSQQQCTIGKVYL